MGQAGYKDFHLSPCRRMIDTAQGGSKDATLDREAAGLSQAGPATDGVKNDHSTELRLTIGVKIETIVYLRLCKNEWRAIPKSSESTAGAGVYRKEKIGAAKTVIKYKKKTQKMYSMLKKNF